MIFVLDTSAYSEFNRGDIRLRKWFLKDNEIIVPLIVVGELRAGFALGSKRKDNEVLLQKFLDSPNVDIVTITNTTTTLFAKIYSKLRQRCKPIGTNDMWIAAIALEHDSVLLTLDDDFDYVPDLKLANI
ncbi:MAG TPA: PIN domain-containing protein [Candidatus Saccharimonadales bacterium]|jgi:predicted nucleic acid-binding protein|nr:PIN domain-containing protein [Candidatus Saccharimonadales bacterium]